MVGHLIYTLLTGEAGNYIARLKRIAGFFIAMAVCAIVMLSTLFAALYVFLVHRYGGVHTSLGFAAVFFLLMLAFWIGLMIVRRPPKKRADDRLKRDIASIAGVAALSNASGMVRAVKRRKSLLLVPVAAAGGFAMWRAVSAFRARTG